MASYFGASDKASEQSNARRFDVRKHEVISLSDSQPTPSTPITELDVKVKGTVYRTTEEIAAARFCDVHDTIVLVPEPDNSVDPNAVKVMTIEGYHIGYVDAEYSELVSSKIDYISNCFITRVSGHEVPYIDIHIDFSTSKTKQPEFIPRDFQCTPEDKMIHLGERSFDSYKYRQVPIMVEGLYELDRETIAKARACKQGDKVLLKKGHCNEYWPYRIDIYLEDGTYIGTADDFHRKEVYMLFDHIVASMVDQCICADTRYRLCLNVYFPVNIECPEDCRVPTGISFHYSGPYPEVKMAQELRKADPLAALDVLLPIAKREKGIDAKIECIACYYQLKDWASRIDSIKNTITHIESLTDADLPPDELYSLNQYLEKLFKQLDFSEKRLESQNKKQAKAIKNSIKFGRVNYLL